MKICTSEEIKQIETKVIKEGIFTEEELMQRAGEEVSKLLIKEFMPKLSSVLIVCGKGNNGGDGFATAEKISKYGKIDIYILCKDETELSPVALLFFNKITRLDNINIFFKPEGINRFDFQYTLIIDAIFGIGINRKPSAHILRTIVAINSSKLSVISLDLPSGVIPDKNLQSWECVKADLTICIQCFKIANLLYPNKKFSGRLRLVYIGLEQYMKRSKREALTPRLVAMSKHLSTIHKYNRGNLLVYAGSEASYGSALMVIEGYLRNSGGMVTLLAEQNAIKNILPLRPECIYYKTERYTTLDLNKFSILILGPGIRRKKDSSLLKYFIESFEGPIVLDADALWHISQESEVFAGILAKKKKINILFTPHSGEAALLANLTVEQVINDPEKALNLIADKFNCMVVLKFSRMIFCNSVNSIVYSLYGKNNLATPGTGDTFCGLIAGVYALQNDLFKASLVAGLLLGLLSELLEEKFPSSSFPITEFLAFISEANSMITNDDDFELMERFS